MSRSTVKYSRTCSHQRTLDEGCTWCTQLALYDLRELDEGRCPYCGLPLEECDCEFGGDDEDEDLDEDLEDDEAIEE